MLHLTFCTYRLLILLYKYINKETMKDDFATEDSFADFVDQLANDEKNSNACSIDNPECEGCGS